MRKLKRQKLHAIYLMIMTVVVCALLWSDIRWEKVAGFAIGLFVCIAAVFDSRYGNFFE